MYPILSLPLTQVFEGNKQNDTDENNVWPGSNEKTSHSNRFLSHTFDWLARRDIRINFDQNYTILS